MRANVSRKQNRRSRDFFRDVKVSRYSRHICKLESSFLSSTKTPQNIYIWITVSPPAVTWALRHVKLLSKKSDLNKRDAKGKTDDRKVLTLAD